MFNGLFQNNIIGFNSIDFWVIRRIDPFVQVIGDGIGYRGPLGDQIELYTLECVDLSSDGRGGLAAGRDM